jgi:hypothetical protein
MGVCPGVLRESKTGQDWRESADVDVLITLHEPTVPMKTKALSAESQGCCWWASAVVMG